MQVIRLTLDQLPPSTNHYKAQRWTGRYIQWYITSEGKEFQELIENLPIIKLWGWKLTSNPVKMSIRLTFPTRRKHDIDNYNKVLLDALQGIIYKDDNQIIELNIRKRYIKGKSRTEIRITELEEQ